LASVVALLGSALIIKNTLDSAAAIKQQADMAGVSATALQELSFAAQQYKVSNDALVDGLKELNLRADEFIQTGKGPAAEAFKRLGYEEDELNEKLKESDKLFVDIIKRMQGLDTAAKIRIADEIFGGQGGEQFASLVNAGADSIEAMRKEAQRLGIVLSDEVVNNSNDATKGLQILGKQLKSQFTNLIAELAPEIEAAATNTTEWIAANKDLLSQDIPKFLGSVTTGMGKLIRATNKLITSMQIITRGFYDPAGAAELFRKEMEKTNEEIRNSVTIPFVDPRTKKTVEENTKALEGALKVVRGMAKPDEMPAVLDPEMIREAKQLWEQTRTPLENLYNSLERLNELWEAGALSQEDYFRAIEMYGEKFTDTFEKAGDIAEAEQKQTLKKVSTLWDRTLENIQDNTGTMLYAEIETTEEEWENFDTICDSTFKERSKDLNRPNSIRPERQYFPALQVQAA
jgi:curved DNA-binding protein CbpA